MEKQLRVLVVGDDDSLKMIFAEVHHIAAEEKDGEDTIDTDKFTVESKRKPHKDLLGCLTKLKKLVLESSETEIDGKELAQWTVNSVKIAGDMTLKKSRVTFTMAKYVKRTKKSIKFGPTPQITMYPEAEAENSYENVDKMTEILEDLVEECWSYLKGKYGDDAQYQLFPEREEEEEPSRLVVSK